MLLAAGCSAEESTTPTVELSTTSTPITTEPTTTEPSTTEAPTTTEDPRIAEVEAAVVAFRETQVEVLTNPDAPLELLEEVAGGELLEAVSENAALARADGRSFSGDYLRGTVGVVLRSAFAATVTECGHDRVQVLSRDGELLTEADESAFIREIEVEYSEDGVWKPVSIVFPGSEKQSCEL